MSMSRLANSQVKVQKALPSRLVMTYETYLPDGTQVQEQLPLVIGVIADLTGDVEEVRPDLADDANRDFRRIHRDNFDEVLARANPHLAYEVPNVIDGQGHIHVDLHLRDMDDFHPDRIVFQVAELRAEQERRMHLENLLNLIRSDPRLESRLQEVLDDAQKRAQLVAQANPPALEAGGATS